MARNSFRIKLELPPDEVVIMSVRKVRVTHLRRMKRIAAERDATLEAVLDAALEAGLGTLEAVVAESEAKTLAESKSSETANGGGTRDEGRS